MGIFRVHFYGASTNLQLAALLTMRQVSILCWGHALIDLFHSQWIVTQPVLFCALFLISVADEPFVVCLNVSARSKSA